MNDRISSPTVILAVAAVAATAILARDTGGHQGYHDLQKLCWTGAFIAALALTIFLIRITFVPWTRRHHSILTVLLSFAGLSAVLLYFQPSPESPSSAIYLALEQSPGAWKEASRAEPWQLGKAGETEAPSEVADEAPEDPTAMGGPRWRSCSKLVPKAYRCRKSQYGQATKADGTKTARTAANRKRDD